MDLALAITEKLSSLDLQTARATEESDKQMIDQLVTEQGGFTEVPEALLATEQSFLSNLQRLKGGLQEENAPEEGSEVEARGVTPTPSPTLLDSRANSAREAEKNIGTVASEGAESRESAMEKGMGSSP
eukprot:CAMPEP_0179201112 /NCGR_PEP_ID=MMETSP0796-20121207/100090_1 /TAXON_ID=73915 /ORGANISM="Pyrodinium bahamense, Strain pbaha01" /LENGTH=128 /DNA_ID=CAMNT_0020905669 /DNA_START=1 /DNA_END=388 /DNA_ORIENTATION=+